MNAIFRSNSGRASAAMALLGLSMALHLVVAVVEAFVIAAPTTPQSRRELDTVLDGLWLVNLALFLFTGIGFLLWFRRAWENALADYLVSTSSPSWSVACWFVPGLHLYVPPGLAAAMWHHADLHSTCRTPWVGRWWLAFVLGLAAAGGSSRLARIARTPADAMAAFVLALAGELLLAAAAGLAIVVVRRLTHAQEAMHLRVQASVFADGPTPAGGPQAAAAATPARSLPPAAPPP